MIKLDNVCPQYITDDKFQKKYDQLRDRVNVKVVNPVDFVKGIDI